MVSRTREIRSRSAARLTAVVTVAVRIQPTTRPIEQERCKRRRTDAHQQYTIDCILDPMLSDCQPELPDHADSQQRQVESGHAKMQQENRTVKQPASTARYMRWVRLPVCRRHMAIASQLTNQAINRIV